MKDISDIGDQLQPGVQVDDARLSVADKRLVKHLIDKICPDDGVLDKRFQHILAFFAVAANAYKATLVAAAPTAPAAKVLITRAEALPVLYNQFASKSSTNRFYRLVCRAYFGETTPPNVQLTSALLVQEIDDKTKVKVHCPFTDCSNSHGYTCWFQSKFSTQKLCAHLETHQKEEEERAKRDYPNDLAAPVPQQPAKKQLTLAQYAARGKARSAPAAAPASAPAAQNNHDDDSSLLDFINLDSPPSAVNQSGV